MLRPFTRALVIGVLFAVAAVLAACPGPTPVPPTPTPVPPTPTPDTGWVEYAAGDLAISLPKEWEVLELGSSDLESLFTEFQRTNPDLAQIIGSAEALQGVSLWAFNRGVADATFVDNLNIRRSSLGGQKIEKMQEVVDAVLAQYEQIGFEVTSTRADLQVGALPGAHIAYNFELTAGDGQQAKVTGHQYLVASATDLWILSYSAGPGRDAALAPVFEQSALSFRVK